MAPLPRTKPRKLPRQDRSRATLEAILTAATRVLVREGFDRATTNRIAEAAGVSIGSLYQYFPSKEALVAALVERHVAEMFAVIGATFARIATLPLRDAAHEIVVVMLRAHAVDPRLHRVLIEQVPRIGRLDHMHDIERRSIELVHGWLLSRRKDIRPRDLELAAFVLVTTVEALTHAAVLSHPERLGSPALADEITDLCVRYLA